MKISERNLFLVSIVLHTSFIGWLTFGEPFFLVFLFSTVSCLILLPISYWLISSVFRLIESKFPDTIPIKNKTITTLILGEFVFLMIFIIASISMVLIKGTEDYFPQYSKPIKVKIIIDESQKRKTHQADNVVEIFEEETLTESQTEGNSTKKE